MPRVAGGAGTVNNILFLQLRSILLFPHVLCCCGPGDAPCGPADPQAHDSAGDPDAARRGHRARELAAVQRLPERLSGGTPLNLLLLLVPALLYDVLTLGRIRTRLARGTRTRAAVDRRNGIRVGIGLVAQLWPASGWRGMSHRQASCLDASRWDLGGFLIPESCSSRPAEGGRTRTGSAEWPVSRRPSGGASRR